MCSSRRSYLRAPDAPSPSTRGPPIGPPTCSPASRGVPTLTWPREIPIDGRPADVAAVVAANAAWTAPTPVAKLFINGDPGALLTGPLRERCRRWPHQRAVTVPGLHFLPEDAPRQIADALDDWIAPLPH